MQRHTSLKCLEGFDRDLAQILLMPVLDHIIWNFGHSFFFADAVWCDVFISIELAVRDGLITRNEVHRADIKSFFSHTGDVSGCISLLNEEDNVGTTTVDEAMDSGFLTGTKLLVIVVFE